MKKKKTHKGSYLIPLLNATITLKFEFTFFDTYSVAVAVAVALHLFFNVQCVRCT